MGIKTVPHRPYSSDLVPCDFWLFPKLRGRRYETIEEMKEAVTKIIGTLTQEDFDWGLPEVVGTVQQVHCSRRRLLRRELEFDVCAINKSAHTKKSGNLFNDPRTYIYIYIYIYIYQRGIFMGDALSLLLSVIVMMPVNLVHRKCKYERHQTNYWASQIALIPPSTSN